MHFVNSKRLYRGSNFLVNIKQGEQESLGSYISRFNVATLEVYNLDHAVTMITIKSGLQRCPFLFSLEKRSSMDFSKMLARVEKYAHIEEMHKAYGPPPSLMVRE